MRVSLDKLLDEESLLEEHTKFMQRAFWKEIILIIVEKWKKGWYDGYIGFIPLDNAINKANRLGWNHHIERLMILANLMNLSEIKPLQVYN